MSVELQMRRRLFDIDRDVAAVAQTIGQEKVKRRVQQRGALPNVVSYIACGRRFVYHGQRGFLVTIGVIDCLDIFFAQRNRL